jgi:transposase
MHEPISGVAGIDPHKHNFTVTVLDGRGALLNSAAFDTTESDFESLCVFLNTVGVEITRIGIEGSNGLGCQLTTFLMGRGFDVREVQANRTAERRRRRHRAKTDRDDAEAIARETLAHDDLPPAGKRTEPNDAWNELVAIRNHRQSLVRQRVRLLNEAEAILTRLPLRLRVLLPATAAVRPRLQAIADGVLADMAVDAAAQIYLAWLVDTSLDIARLDGRVKGLEKRIPDLLEMLGSTLPEEKGIAAVSAMELLVEVGDPTRFRTESAFARWCGTAPIAASSGEGRGKPTHHRLDLAGNRYVNSVLHTMHVTQIRCHEPAKEFVVKKRTEGKTVKEARRAHKRQLANRIIRRMWADEQKMRACNYPKLAA